MTKDPYEKAEGSIQALLRTHTRRWKGANDPGKGSIRVLLRSIRVLLRELTNIRKDAYKW